MTTDLLFFQKDQAKNLNEDELVFSGSIPLRMIIVSGSILILMGNTIHKFWVNMRYVILMEELSMLRGIRNISY